MDRRTYLLTAASGLSLATAGCLFAGHNKHRIEMEPVEDEYALGTSASVSAMADADVYRAVTNIMAGDPTEDDWRTIERISDPIIVAYLGGFYEFDRPEEDSTRADAMEGVRLLGGTAGEYADYLYDEYHFELTDLTEDMRENVEDAIEDEALSTIDETPDGFRPLWDRITGHPTLPPAELYQSTVDYLLEYEGQDYIAKTFHSSGG